MSGPLSALLPGRPQPSMLCSSSWQCRAELASVLTLSAADGPAQNEEEAAATPCRERCVLLELPIPPKEDGPCTLTLLCAAQGKDRILGVTLCSEARTIEIYSASQDGQEEDEYLGTSRGQRFCTLESSGEETPAVLYKAHLKFEFPVSSCIVKLLSLGGRCSVLVSEISVQMTSVPDRCPQASFVPGSSINLDRVQSIMDSMGGKMSPGAEQLMSMVRAQQKHQAPFGAHFMQLFGSFQHSRDQITEEAGQHKPLAGPNLDTTVGNESQDSASPSSGLHTRPDNHVKSAMSSLLQTAVGSAAAPHGPDSLLPLLRNLCAQNRKEPSSGLKEEKCDPALEKLLSVHMQRMERTLTAHIDQRMRSLQEHVDTRLDQIINLMQTNSLSRNSSEKLVNGQSELGHHQDYEYDDLSMD
ncbi:ATPase PAAT [Anomaloglossus baeobatrachus]|uniref:ATPase PAAT n=1 Tax=Anomaloglossus baeobatrachus TaxID=238106 RepID=UPI003F50631C